MKYDLLLKHGTLVDPAQGVNAARDIAFTNGKVAAVADDLPAAARQIDCTGLIVAPGMIDLHVHVYDGVSHYGIPADSTCLARGVTTALDAGSSGAATFAGFRRYVIETSEGKVGIATDLGLATRLVAERLKGCRVLILEANHDEEMLRDGPYPWPLKQRIRSNHGHLSNTASAQLLQGLLWEGLEAVFLAHLSEVNNRPGLAESCAAEVLARQNLCRPQIILGCQGEPSACFRTTP